MEFYKLLADDELLAIFNHFIELLWAFIAQRCQFQKKPERTWFRNLNGFGLPNTNEWYQQFSQIIYIIKIDI